MNAAGYKTNRKQRMRAANGILTNIPFTGKNSLAGCQKGIKQLQNEPDLVY
jgi:hypothetical protein